MLMTYDRTFVNSLCCINVTFNYNNIITTTIIIHVIIIMVILVHQEPEEEIHYVDSIR